MNLVDETVWEMKVVWCPELSDGDCNVCRIYLSQKNTNLLKAKINNHYILIGT